MDKRHVRASKLILDCVYNHRDMYTERMLHLTSELRSCYGRTTLAPDRIREMIGILSARLLCDEIEELNADALGEDTYSFVRRAIFRVGTFMAILASAGDELTDAHISHIVALVQNLDVMPQQSLASLLGEFDGRSVPQANDHARRLLTMVGISPANTPVMEYSHPIDSGIIAALDTPVVNAIFKKQVDMFSDVQQGQMMASAIPVTPHNFLELNAIVDECAMTTGIKRPDVVVTSAISGLNAMTFGSEDKPCIAVGSLMLKRMKPEQLRFVIGHECGHIAMGHVVYHVAASMLSTFSIKIPVIGKVAYDLVAFPLTAWSRRSEITADRAGLVCCGSVETAKRTLLQLEAAFVDADEVNMDEYLDWSRNYRSGGVLRRTGELLAAHPMLPKRIEALTLFAKSTAYYSAIDGDAPADALPLTELNDLVEASLKVL